MMGQWGKVGFTCVKKIVFAAAANDLDEHSYQDSFNTRMTNRGSLQNSDLLHQAKEDAHRKGDKVLNKQAKYTLEKEIRVAKRNYSGKLRIQLSSSDSASVWKGMKDITSYKTPSPSTVENQQQADNLNEFYYRFEKTPHTHSGHLSTQPLTPPATPLSPILAIQIIEDEVCQVFQKQKRKKTICPDGVTPACLKSCADQLSPIFTKIFNRSLEL